MSTTLGDFEEEDIVGHNDLLQMNNGSHKSLGSQGLDFFNISWGQDDLPNATSSQNEFPITTDIIPTEIPTGITGWTDFAMVCVFCAIIAGTVAGNTLVIAAVVTTRRLRTVTNCFVMSLAVADWLVGVFVMPPKVALYLVNNKWKLGGFFCEVWIALDILLCTASILSLCAISIDRYLAITRPLAYSRRRRSKRLALSMISCVWVAATVITSPPIFGWYEENRNVENKCDYNENTGYVVYSALGSFFLPLLVMLYVYARIACVIARRQTSIQKLSNPPEKHKSQCYIGHEPDAPLRKGLRSGSYKRGTVVDDENVEAKYNDTNSGDEETQQQALHLMNSPELVENDGVGCETVKRSTFWTFFRIHSCTSSGDDDNNSGIGTKRSSSGGPKSGSSDSECNSASGLAISLPDPATLVGSVEGPGQSEIAISRSSCSSPRNCEQLGNSATSQISHQYLQGQSHHPSSRTRTGSRLCHHSLATASPQRNIHRVHQTTSSTTRLFHDHELLPLEESKNISKSAPRVWTVEETSNATLGVGSGGRHKNPNGRVPTSKQEQLHGRNCRFPGATLSVNSPAGNPASLMSSPNVGTHGSSGDPSPSHLHNVTSSARGTNRYHPQQVNHYAHHQVPSMSGIHRGRSIKLKSHGNDHNQNGSSTIARDFASGRIASFKRETKTAQTLAAVVGGFIICWLPFFVAYVLGPFLPPHSIPDALMDALIWLGWSNSTINPFIYAFYSADFRSAFWRLTVRKCGILLDQRRSNNERMRSPRRYDDHHTQSRVST